MSFEVEPISIDLIVESPHITNFISSAFADEISEYSSSTPLIDEHSTLSSVDTPIQLDSPKHCQTSLERSEYPNLSFNNLDLSHCDARVAYDIGSGSTKIMGALYNTQTGTIEHIFSNYNFPMTYSLDLAQSESNAFSDLIMEMGLNTLKEYQDKVKSDFQGLNLDIMLSQYGAATAAFRKADNAQIYLENIYQQLDLPICIISQSEEGILGYQGSLIGAKELEIQNPVSLCDPIVWDIGGGSMQITHKEENGEFTIMQGQVASSTFQALVCEHVKCFDDVSHTPNPINYTEFEAIQKLAREFLEFDPQATQTIFKHIQDGCPIYAIGSVHNFSVQGLINKLDNTNSHTYTKTDVLNAAHTLIGLNDHQIVQITGGPKQFAKSQLTNLILIHEVMDKLGIERVTTVKTNNTEGLIVNGPIRDRVSLSI